VKFHYEQPGEQIHSLPIAGSMNLQDTFETLKQMSITEKDTSLDREIAGMAREMAGDAADVSGGIGGHAVSFMANVGDFLESLKQDLTKAQELAKEVLMMVFDPSQRIGDPTASLQPGVNSGKKKSLRSDLHSSEMTM